MRYRLAKKKLKKNVLLNLWIGHAKDNIEIVSCYNNTLSDLSRLVMAISYKMLNFEFSQMKKIQKSMGMRNFQFFHYVGDKMYGNIKFDQFLEGPLIIPLLIEHLNAH